MGLYFEELSEGREFACGERAIGDAEIAAFAELSGDRNPLHRDPQYARRLGFERPVLQGLCTWGIACRAIVTGACDYAAERISAFEARLSAPVYPGETIVTDLWVDGPLVSFRSRVKERDIIALDHGRCILGFP